MSRDHLSFELPLGGDDTNGLPVPPLPLALRVSVRDLALEHIQQGVGVFDGEQRLLLFNRRFAEIYNLARSELRLGMTLREIITLRAAAGSGPAMQPEHYAAWRDRINVSDRVLDTEVILEDRRTIVIHHEPLDGGGWVTTHDDITGRRRAETRIRHMAHHDQLTALPNRAFFSECLDQTLSRLRGDNLDDHRPAPVTNWVLAVLLLDLDHFKDVNDTRGHAAGDELLRLVGHRIAHVLSAGDVLARLGGDEFAILLEGLADPEDAAIVAARVIETVSAPFHLSPANEADFEARVGASIGITVCTSADRNVTQALLLSQADMALYRVKADGRGAYRFFDPAMSAALQKRTEIERDLRKTIAGRKLDVFYQPQIDLVSNEVVGFEALARWPHPTHGLIPPAEFIPVAESIGLIGALGDWVLRTACAAARGWGIRISVNLSADQVRDAGLIKLVTEALAQTGLPASMLEFEITETLLLHDTAPILAKLNRLRDMGIGIALDDFGTGYSSLSYLSRLPLTKLKIDRSFVANLTSDPATAAIVQAIITLGRSLSLRINAEGVETPEQLAALRRMGCDEVQGYLTGRPAALEPSGMAPGRPAVLTGRIPARPTQ